MPVPRRNVSLLANTDGTFVMATKNHKRQPRTVTNCQRCGCILARDQLDPYCSPCQITQHGVPDPIIEYLEAKP